MNQSNTLRLFVLFGLSYKHWQTNTDHNGKLFEQLAQVPNHLALSSKNPTINLTNILKINTQIPLYWAPELPKQQEESQDIDIDRSINISSDGKILKKNLIQNRILHLQYQANNPCQDSLIFNQLESIDGYTISIFDGHGGPELAQYSKTKISQFIDSYIHQNRKNNKYNNSQDISQLLKDSLTWSYQKIQDTFFQIYEQQIKIGNKKIRNVGTCGITAIVHNDSVYIGNSGDSQAIFITEEDKQTYGHQKANKRLSTKSKSERNRLQKTFGDKDEEIITEESKNCFYLKGILQPTRTIGDYYLKKKTYFTGSGEFHGPYLECTPDIQTHKITSKHKYIVIASDGLWDALTKTQVVNSLMNQKKIDLSKTCDQTNHQDFEPPYIKQLLEKTLSNSCQMCGITLQELKKMKLGLRRDYHDDISIAVVNLYDQI